jgi:hypothetical protein
MNLNAFSSDTNSAAAEIKHFFDKSYTTDVSFPCEEIDAVIGFFQKRNFDANSAKATAIVFLNRARTEEVHVFTLLDSLKQLPTLQLNQIVAQILNSYRDPTSLLGYRVKVNDNEYESRNILV